MALFFLRAVGDGSLFYLAPKKTYTVGRKDSDLLITNDSSISRNHAIFYVRGSSGNSIVLKDCKSKYKTFVNESEIQPERDIFLNIGDTIKFGAFQSIYKLDFVKIITTGSALSKEENSKLTECIHFLNGTVVKQWHEDVQFVTTKTLVMTVKTLCAIVEGKSIVTLKFWEVCLDHVKKNMCLPSTTNYLPPWGEETINRNISLAYNPLRKTLFKDKIFIFPTNSLKTKMEDIITHTGGMSTVWDKNIINTKQLEGPVDKFIIINDYKTDNSYKIPKTLADILKHLQEIGKRPIPLQEIVLAVLNCSCEKDCNPSFKRADMIIPKTNTGFATDTENVLVQATETQDALSEIQGEKLETIIPESFDNEVSAACSFPESQVIVIEDVECVKRKNTSFNANVEHASKKHKPSSTSKTTSDKSVTSTIVNPFATTTPRQTYGVVDGNKLNKSKTMNPFALLLNNDDGISKCSNTDVVKTSAALKRNINSSIDESHISKKQKIIDVISSTVASDVNNEEVTIPNISSIKTEDNVSIKTEWMCDATSFKTSNETNVKTEDDEMKKFFESFKNSVIIQTSPLIVKRRVDSNITNTSENGGNVKNFKKFKKRTPLRPQKTVIPTSSFIRISCGYN